MEIRLMRTDDYGPVRGLWLSCAGMGLNDRDDSEAGISAFLARNPETCFVAEDGGKIVGAVLCGNDGRRAFIYHTAVSPLCRKRGIGRALVVAVEDALGRLGISKAALVVFSRNEAGNAFWEKLGFTERTDLSYRNKAFVELRRIDT